MSRRSERTVSVLVPPDLAPTTPEDPSSIGPYVLVGRLGSTGAGSVYAAVHPDVEPDVLLAVKVVPPALVPDEAARARLEQRLRVLGAVDGRCYVPPVAFDVRSTPAWLATRYAPGTPLEQYTRQRGPMTLGRLTALAAGLGEGLSALHSLDLVHGDLKPGSVLLSSQGPRILDCALSGETAVPPGSAPWLSPERLRGEAPTPASDVFSWGAVLAFAGTGRPPFGTGTPEEVAGRIGEQQPDLDGVADEIRPLLESALAADPGERPDVRSLVRSSIELWETGLGSVGSDAGRGSGVTRVLHREWQGIVEPALLPRVVHVGGRPKGKKGGRLSSLTMPVPVLSSLQQTAPEAAPAKAQGAGSSGSDAGAVPTEKPAAAAEKPAAASAEAASTTATFATSTAVAEAPPAPVEKPAAVPAQSSGGPSGSGGSNKRLLLLAGGGAAALLLVGGVVWGAVSLLGGDSPAPQQNSAQPASGGEETPEAAPPPEWDSGTLVVRLDSSSEVNLLSGPWPYTPVEPASGDDAFAGQNGSELTPQDWSERWTPVEGADQPLEALISSDAEVMCAHFCLNPDQVFVDEDGRGTYKVTGRDLANYLSWGDVVIAEVTFGDRDPETGLPVITAVTELYPPAG
ncbi:serine/threonine-protein kinase [Thermobifida cellulosilytica]|uniref:Tyrosine protein kinase n=1 Tax=Thermobifida cellulosilytica TB100 TaxID=665004 RepID=A0A147KFP1_THECS|nr:serine/threonine-protein kinase [Thermobifida cellulosilytica]KUP96131.1 tyrosine protein kinase [Thermobifida cellulosilytica TB100]